MEHHNYSISRCYDSKMKIGSGMKHNKIIGAWGEQIAANYLKNKGFTVLDRNYRKKWGEIDIVARDTEEKVHFVEVKTVSYETKQQLSAAVTRRTWRPEENVHAFKLHKLQHVIASWLMDNEYYGLWQIDIIAVRLVSREKFATVKYLPNIVL